MYMLQKRNLFN